MKNSNYKKNKKYKALEFKHSGGNHTESYNQDYTSVRSKLDGSIFAAIADGCSSEPLSGFGAYFICEAITSFFCETETDIYAMPVEDIKHLIDQIISNKLNYLCDSVLKVTERYQPVYDNNEDYYYCAYIPPRIFACTLIVALSLSNSRQIIYHIGDGVVLGLNNDGKTVDVLSEGRNIGSQCRTFFATDSDFTENGVIKEFTNHTYTDLFLTTDGLQKALANGPDTISNLMELLTSLADYGSTFEETFNESMTSAVIDPIKKSAPDRLADDISCIWISEQNVKEIFNNDSSIAVTVKTKADSLHEVTNYSFNKSKLVIKLKKKKSQPEKKHKIEKKVRAEKKVKAKKKLSDVMAKREHNHTKIKCKQAKIYSNEAFE